jgi:hypothetical protein
VRRSILSKVSMEDLNANQALDSGTVNAQGGLDNGGDGGVVQVGAEPVVQFTGPLGEEVTKALQAAYDKDALLGDPNAKPAEPAAQAPTDGAGDQPQGKDTSTDGNVVDSKDKVSMESQANDALGGGLPQGQVQPATDAPVDTIAYVVNENTIDVPTVVDAAQAIDQAEEDKDFILIIDGTMDPENGLEGVPQERKVELVTALESIARSKDVKVFRSVKAFLEQ